MNENEEKLRVIAEDCKAVIEEAKSMGCNKVRALYNIPLENMELIVQALEKQTPTTYDIGKVVEELEENASRYTKKYVTPYGNNGYKDTKAISIHKAIEIVKQGVVSDDVCEWREEGLFLYTSCGDIVKAYSDDFKYCPYCSKQIKVVE